MAGTRQLLSAAAIAGGLSFALAGAALAQNQSQPVSGISNIRPELSMRAPRSFRDPAPGGGTAQPVNRSFDDLYFRFVGAVSDYDREASIGNVLQNPHPQAAGRRQVRRAARDVAAGKANAAQPRPKPSAN
jgi:hypothetical protein